MVRVEADRLVDEATHALDAVSARGLEQLVAADDFGLVVFSQCFDRMPPKAKRPSIGLR